MEFKPGDMTVMRGCDNCNCDKVGLLFKIRSISLNKVTQRCLQKEYFENHLVVGNLYVNGQKIGYVFPLSYLYTYTYLNLWHT